MGTFYKNILLCRSFLVNIIRLYQTQFVNIANIELFLLWKLCIEFFFLSLHNDNESTIRRPWPQIRRFVCCKITS